MIKLVAKQKIGFRNPETGEIVTAEPYAFSTLPDWVEKDPMYGWALADGSIEIGSEQKAESSTPPAEGDGAKKEPKASKNQKKDAGADKQQEGDNTPPAEGDGAKKE